MKRYIETQKQRGDASTQKHNLFITLRYEYDNINMFALCTQMPKKDLHVRLSDRRLNKVRQYAANKDKTVTQVIEELIDTLPDPK
ncbi:MULTISPECIES: hypothetical protein [Nostocales]|uniref:hypothetical protein n=2 Tax=Nostocales TaxID=1161 RepID=UPI0016891508|nr:MULTISPECIES: hypothetical protein [Nostocales]MBD2486394.1 hypothetical protein [Aulosira sp. FACHB-615]